MKTTLLATTAVLSLLAGCASGPVYQLSKVEQAQYANIPSETVVNDLQAKLVQARTDRLDYYASADFAKAQSAAAAIKKLSLDKSHRQEILEYAAMAQNSIADGYIEKKKAIKVFADVLALDTRLKELGAPTLQPDAYTALAARLVKLMGTLEKGDNATADKTAAALKGDMEALKIRITKQKALSEAKALGKALRDIDAAAIAPKSVHDAEDSLDRADAYIQMHPDDQTGISKAANDALIEARHAQWVTARIKHLTAMQTPPYEAIILGDEQRLASVGKALSVGDNRDKTLDQQAAAIIAQVQEMEQELGKVKTRNTTLEDQINRYQSSVGTEDTRTQKLLSENDLLKQKVSFLETNVGMLKNQLKLLQDILFAKTGKKIPVTEEADETPPPAPSQGQPAKEQAATNAPANAPAKAAANVDKVAGPVVTPPTPKATTATQADATKTPPTTPAETTNSTTKVPSPPAKAPTEASTDKPATHASTPAKTTVAAPVAQAKAPAAATPSSDASTTVPSTAPNKQPEPQAATTPDTPAKADDAK